MAKYGLAYEHAKAVNAEIIYLSINGFGSLGPDHMLPVTDAVIQAFSGLMTVSRSSDGVPNRLTMIPVDVVTGFSTHFRRFPRHLRESFGSEQAATSRPA
jgi:crotonobetainyl-CoA:carnitine CoA-transferase CaiB-like acyl-CoA transferase